MKDVIIVSGGNIQRDFALDFLKKNKTEKVDLIAADRGVEFFKGTDWQPEVAIGDFEEQFGKYVSFFSLEGDLTGLTLRGFKYPLNKYHLKVSDSGLTVSNEIVDEEACVEFDAGSLLMLMTRD